MTFNDFLYKMSSEQFDVYVALFDLYREQAQYEGIADDWVGFYEDFEEELTDRVLGVTVSIYNHLANGEPLPLQVYCDNEVIVLWKMLILDFENNSEFLRRRLAKYG